MNTEPTNNDRHSMFQNLADCCKTQCALRIWRKCHPTLLNELLKTTESPLDFVIHTIGSIGCKQNYEIKDGELFLFDVEVLALRTHESPLFFILQSSFKCVLTRKIILFNPMLSILSPTTPYTSTHTEIIRNQSLFFQFTCNPQIASNYSQKSCFLQKVPFSILGVRKGVRKDGFMRPKDGFKRPFRTRPDQKYG